VSRSVRRPGWTTTGRAPALVRSLRAASTPRGEPSCGAYPRMGLDGRRNADVLPRIAATADVSATSTNPSGANQPPGRNPAPITDSKPGDPRDRDRQRQRTVQPDRAGTDDPDSGCAGWPNRSWTAIITELAPTSATIAVEQPLGTVVLTVGWDLSSPTPNNRCRKVSRRRRARRPPAVRAHPATPAGHRPGASGASLRHAPGAAGIERC
jgi:hypothetical protein